eukprot:365172-Amphidinium_carterae.1
MLVFKTEVTRDWCGTSTSVVETSMRRQVPTSLLNPARAASEAMPTASTSMQDRRFSRSFNIFSSFRPGRESRPYQWSREVTHPANTRLSQVVPSKKQWELA